MPDLHRHFRGQRMALGSEMTIDYRRPAVPRYPSKREHAPVCSEGSVRHDFQ